MNLSDLADQASEALEAAPLDQALLGTSGQPHRPGEVKSVSYKCVTRKRGERITEEWKPDDAEFDSLQAAVDFKRQHPGAHVVAARPRSGRAPRRATNQRRRGSRRSTASRGDPDDGGDPDLEIGGGASPAAGRICEAEGCGESIDHLRPQATTCSDACRQAKRRGRKRPPHVVVAPPRRSIASTPFTEPCPHPATVPDEEGDPTCILCGSLVGTPSRPNGYEEFSSYMVARDPWGDPWRKPRRLGYLDLPHLRTRTVPVGVELPQSPRTCRRCGAYLRHGNRGPRCAPCANAEVVAA